MKPIKFEELSVSGKNIIWIILLVFCGLFPFLNLFDLFTFLEPTTLKRVNAACFLTLAIYHLRPFMHRNYVQWNKRGITIRVNSLLGTNFSFENVKNIVYAEDRYTVYTYSGGRPKVIDLEGIEPGSKERLLGVLQQYVSS